MDKTDNLERNNELLQKFRIDKDMNWIFDPSVSPKDIFQIRKIIGRGGFGVVCHVFCTATQLSYAGKIIDNIKTDSNVYEAIQHEISVMKTIKSPYLIKYFGRLQWEEKQMLLLEYCNKGSFSQILEAKRGGLTEAQISIAILDLTRGIKSMHDSGFVHRDVKAGNLLLNDNGEIKLCDFGVSEYIDLKNDNHESIAVIGSPYWMAPEIISGEKYTFAADIWGIGITAVELSEGAPPLIEYSPTKAMIEITRNGFPGFRRPQDHSQLFTSFIINCLMKDPKERPSIDVILSHPFLKRANTLDRKKELANLMDLQLQVNVSDPLIQKFPQSSLSSNHSSSVRIASARDLNMGTEHSVFESSSLFSLPSTLPNFSSSNGNPFASSADFSSPDSGKSFAQESMDFKDINSSINMENDSKKVFHSLEYNSRPGVLENSSELVSKPRPRQDIMNRRPMHIIRHSERIDPKELHEQFEEFLKTELDDKIPSMPDFHINNIDDDSDYSEIKPSQMPQVSFNFDAPKYDPSDY